MTTIREYAEDLESGKINLCEVPLNLRKDVISLLRELLAIAEAMKEMDDTRNTRRRIC